RALRGGACAGRGGEPRSAGGAAACGTRGDRTESAAEAAEKPSTWRRSWWWLFRRRRDLAGACRALGAVALSPGPGLFGTLAWCRSACLPLWALRPDARDRRETTSCSSRAAAVGCPPQSRGKPEHRERLSGPPGTVFERWGVVEPAAAGRGRSGIPSGGEAQRFGGAGQPTLPFHWFASFAPGRNPGLPPCTDERQRSLLLRPLWEREGGEGGGSTACKTSSGLVGRSRTTLAGNRFTRVR